MELTRHSNQVSLVIVNSLFLLAGGAGLIAGLLMHIDPSLVKTIMAKNNVNLNTANPSTGVVICVTSFLCLLVSVLGCAGALCKLTTALVLYSFFLMIILVAEITSTIFFASSSGNTSIYVERSMRALLRGYNESQDVHHAIKTSARILFSVFSCCGVLSPADFNGTQFRWIKDATLRRPNASRNFPLACCSNITVDTRDVTPVKTNVTRGGDFSACFGNITSETAFLRGCLTVIDDLINFYSDYLILLGIGAVLLEIVLIVLSARQCLQIRQKLIYEKISLTRNLPLVLPKTKPSTPVATTPTPASIITTTEEETSASTTQFTTQISGKPLVSELTSVSERPSESSAVDFPGGLSSKDPEESSSWESASSTSGTSSV